MLVRPSRGAPGAQRVRNRGTAGRGNDGIGSWERWQRRLQEQKLFLKRTKGIVGVCLIEALGEGANLWLVCLFSLQRIRSWFCFNCTRSKITDQKSWEVVVRSRTCFFFRSLTVFLKNDLKNYVSSVMTSEKESYRILLR